MSVLGVVVAIILGAALAGATTIGVVKVNEQTPKNTTKVEQALFPYGDR
jgi:hypothetical protein